MDECKYIIGFRCDAATINEYGSGHVRRCLAIAETFITSYEFKISDICFIISYEENYFSHKILNGYNFDLYDVNDILSNKLKVKCKVFIFDILNIEKSYIYKLSNILSASIVLIDHSDGCKLRCNLSFNIHVNCTCDLERCKSYSGLDYGVLPSFNVNTQNFIEKNDVFVFVGSHDNKNRLPEIIEELSQFPLMKGNIIVTNEKDFRLVTNLIQIKLLQNIKVVKNPSNFYDLLFSSRFAVLSGGIISFDANFLGIPIIGIYQYDHQLVNLKRLVQKNTDNMSIIMDNDFKNNLKFTLKKIYTKDTYLVVKVLDGEGLNRITSIIYDKCI